MTCHACRKAKKACDGNEDHPCARCVKAGQPCIPVTPKKKKSAKTPSSSMMSGGGGVGSTSKRMIPISSIIDHSSSMLSPSMMMMDALSHQQYNQQHHQHQQYQQSSQQYQQQQQHQRRSSMSAAMMDVVDVGYSDDESSNYNMSYANQQQHPIFSLSSSSSSTVTTASTQQQQHHDFNNNNSNIMAMMMNDGYDQNNFGMTALAPPSLGFEYDADAMMGSSLSLSHQKSLSTQQSHSLSNISVLKPQYRLSRIDHLYLVPMRIDLDDEGIRVIDFFSWHVLQSDCTVQQFAEWYSRDMKLPSNTIPLIVKSINAQLTRFCNLFSDTYFCHTFFDAENDLSVTIKLDVRLQGTVLKDQFEWNILNGNVSPEQFAQQLCEDIAIDLHFMPMVSNAIREQIFQFIFQKYERYLQLVQRARNQASNDDTQVVEINFNDVVQKVQVDQPQPLPQTTTTTTSSSTQQQESKQEQEKQNQVQKEQKEQKRRGRRRSTKNTKKRKRKAEAESSDSSDSEREDNEEKSTSKDRDNGMDDGDAQDYHDYTDDPLFRDEDEVDEWRPRIEILDEEELERIAAKEERESRYRRRRL